MGPFIVIVSIAIVIVIIIVAVRSKDKADNKTHSTKSAPQDDSIETVVNLVRQVEKSRRIQIDNPESFLDFLPNWDSQEHNSTKQLERQNRAQSILSEMKSFQYERQTATFLSEKHDCIIETTLFGCQCDDFKYRAMPCKHMYALAMGLYQNDTNQTINCMEPLHELGVVKSKLLTATALKKKSIDRFIAFDTETTGVNSSLDRIVELGAVIFENGIIVDQFSSLVNPNMEIPPEATAVNHITPEMVATAPQESTVYPDFIRFIGDAISGKTLLCAHNARFDKEMISLTLERLGYDASLIFVDTLQLARIYAPGLENYKLQTVAKYYNITNPHAHRAVTDAEVCGKILLNILPEIIPPVLEKPKSQKPITPKAEQCKTPVVRKKPEKTGPSFVPKQRPEDQRHNKHALYQLDDDNGIIAKYESIADAVKTTGINSKSIRDAANGKQKHAGGYTWRFIEDFEPVEIK